MPYENMNVAMATPSYNDMNRVREILSQNNSPIANPDSVPWDDDKGALARYNDIVRKYQVPDSTKFYSDPRSEEEREQEIARIMAKYR